jgi:bacterial/archaeal transporter family protein
LRNVVQWAALNECLSRISQTCKIQLRCFKELIQCPHLDTPGSERSLLMPSWFAWTMVAVVSWGIWAILSKLIGDALSGPHSQALSTFGLLPVLIGLAFTKRARPGGPRRLQGMSLALLSGVVSALGNVSYYQSLASGAKAATVVPLTALYPIVTIALATLFLHEKLNRIQSAGVALSLLAIYLFNVPDEKGFMSGALGHAIMPMVLWGAAGFLQKLTTNQISGELSAVCFLAAFVPLAVFLLWREPLNFMTISGRTWLLVIALGLFLAVGNVAVLVAFAREGKASIIAPLAGLYPVISVPIAITLLGEKVGSREFTGIVLALLSVVALAMETQNTLTANEELV